MISIVIPSLNTAEHLGRMLSSLASSGSKEPTEIIVVDMSSTDGTIEMLKSDFPEVTVLADVLNKGYGAAANTGLARATGSHVLVCNSDLAFPDGSMDQLAKLLREVDEKTLVGFRLEGLDGRPQRSVHRLPGRFALTWMFAAPLRYWPRLNSRLMGYMNEEAMTQRTPVGWVTGAALGAHRTLFDRLGGFDEAFFMNSEEVDLCARVQDLGGTVLYAPEITLVHMGGGSSPDSTLPLTWLAEGKARYTRKHFSRTTLWAARLGAVVAYLGSFPVWMGRWAVRRTTFGQAAGEVVRYGRALEGAWRV